MIYDIYIYTVFIYLYTLTYIHTYIMTYIDFLHVEVSFVRGSEAARIPRILWSINKPTCIDPWTLDNRCSHELSLSKSFHNPSTSLFDISTISPCYHHTPTCLPPRGGILAPFRSVSCPGDVWWLGHDTCHSSHSIWTSGPRKDVSFVPQILNIMSVIYSLWWFTY